MKTLYFFHNCRSPYSALATHMVARDMAAGLAEMCALKTLPFGVGDGDMFYDPAAHPQKLNYVIQDVIRLYAAEGLAIQPPQGVNTDLEPAMRAGLAAEAAGYGLGFNHALSMLRWCEGRDVSEDDVLGVAAAQCGWSADAAVEAARGPDWVSARADAITQSRDFGVFGVPFFVIEDGDRRDPYWGQDRWWMVKRALEG